MPAEFNGLLEDNPDRGWTSKETYYIPAAGSSSLRDSYETILKKVRGYLSTNTYDQNAVLSRVMISMRDYKTTAELPQETVEYIRNILKAYKELGVKVYFNIFYQHGHEDSIVTADIVLRHIDYYAPIWAEYSDTIYSYCISLIGSWGEWTSTGNGVDDIPAMTNNEKQAITDKVLESIPDDMYLTMRQPSIKTKYVSADNELYSSIGYDQSAFFGLDFPDNDMGQSNYRPGHVDYQTVINEAPYAPMHAETFTTRWFNNEGAAIESIDALGAIKALSQQRITSFNVNHGYGDIKTYGGKITDTILYGWKLERINESKLEELGVLYTDSWFKNGRGKAVYKNAFDYIKDYLGYRISADSLSVTGGNNAGEEINISMNLKNYGFSAAFNLESGFAILDENNNVVSEIIAGNPARWHSTSAENYADRTQLIHNVTANMNLPTAAGTYKIAFFMRNKLGQNARLDNLIEYANGFNILHMFSVN